MDTVHKRFTNFVFKTMGPEKKKKKNPTKFRVSLYVLNAD